MDQGKNAQPFCSQKDSFFTQITPYISGSTCFFQFVNTPYPFNTDFFRPRLRVGLGSAMLNVQAWVALSNFTM